MRNMLAFLAALLLTVAGLGWYLGWFTLQTVPGEAGHRNVTVDIDTSKIGADLRDAEQSLEKKLADRANKAAAEKGEKTEKQKLERTPALGSPAVSVPKADR
jgi:hypothetical protein